MDQNLPIDIHYNKLLDWLVNRRHCSQQWQSTALVVREKINNAIQDMPAVDEITQLLTGTYINYFHCLRIVELLRDTESGTKNIFGRYSSQRMKDWQEVVKLYENNGTYLAEAAQMLMRNVNYEIPSLKKQIAKLQQQQQECTRKEGEYKSQAAELKEKYHVSCRQMGIKGEKVKKELISLVKDLPATYEQITRDVKSLQPACAYYEAFIQFLLGETGTSNEYLKMVKHISNKGNTTVYEWEKGIVPSSVVEVTLDLDEGEEEVTAVDDTGAEIDWGGIEAENGIDFDISLEGGGDTIDFGDEGVGIDVAESGSSGIDFGEDVTEATADSLDVTVARGREALSILDQTKTRNLFLDELHELDAFFCQRLHEMGETTDTVTSSLLQNAPEILQQDRHHVEALHSAVTAVLQQLTNSRMQDLMLIRSSPRYVDRLTEKLKKILSDSEKMIAMSQLMVTRRHEAKEEQEQTQPKLDLLRSRTKELQRQIEKEISKKYKNRPVNIMGEINTV